MKLQTLGAGFEAGGQPGRLAVGPAWLVDAGKVDESVSEEPPGVCLVESGEGFFQPISPAAVQVDDRSDSRQRPSRRGTE